MLNSECAKLSQSCTVVLVFKAELRLWLFVQEALSRCRALSKRQSALVAAGARCQAHGEELACAQGFAQVTASVPRARAAQRRSLNWNRGRAPALFLHQLLLIPELPHVSQADFKTQLGPEPLGASFQ